MKRKDPPVNNANPKILVVDDDSEIGDIIKMALQRQGYDVFYFTDPLLALKYFRINHRTCNLVISDLRMPQMNGFEFVSNIRLIKPKTFVVIMSAFNMEDLEFSMHSKKPDNINGFIQKPISMRNLIKLVKSYAIEN